MLRIVLCLSVFLLILGLQQPSYAGWPHAVIDQQYRNTQYDLQEIGGRPAILYVQEQNSTGWLKYAYSTDSIGTTWQMNQFTDNVLGSPCKLASLGGLPIAAYSNTVKGIIYFGANSCSGQGWASTADALVLSDTTVRLAGIVNFDCRLRALAEKPSSATLTLLSYKVAGAWDVTTLIYSGHSPALEMVSGQPALAFFRQSSGDLYFGRQGTGGWTTEIKIGDSNGLPIASHQVVLRMVNGKPYAMYSASGGLRFVSATDSTGSQWESQFGVIADSWPTIFDLEVDGAGRPMVAYKLQIGAENDVMYRQADITGKNWGAADAIWGLAPQSIDLEVISGKPAVAFSVAESASVTSLHYARQE
jgi:hypothetical protein